jgi:hypothetical protein
MIMPNFRGFFRAITLRPLQYHIPQDVRGKWSVSKKNPSLSGGWCNAPEVEPFVRFLIERDRNIRSGEYVLARAGGLMRCSTD